jgi:hypothetical protein
MEDLGVDMEATENVSIAYEIYKLKSIVNQSFILNIYYF